MTRPPCHLCDMYDHWLYRRTDDAHRAHEAASHNPALTTASHRADASLAELQKAKDRHIDHAHPDNGDGGAA